MGPPPLLGNLETEPGLNREVCCSMRGQHGTSTPSADNFGFQSNSHIHALSDSLIKRHTLRSPTSYLLAHSTALLDLRSEPTPRVVFVLGFVSLINSLTSGKT